MKVHIFILFFILLVNFGYAQEPGMKNFNTYDGLPSDEVYKGKLATNGYLWFATNDGVCYFDGEDFTSFDMDDGLSENTILSLEEDAEGRMWFVGLSGRLSYYYKGKISLFEGNDLIMENKSSIDIPASGHLTPISVNEVKLGLFSSNSLHIKGDKCRVYSPENNDSLAISKQFNKYLFYMNRAYVDSVKYTVVFDSIPYAVTLKINRYWGHYSNYNLYLEYPDRIIFFAPNTVITIFNNGEHKVVEFPYVTMCAIKGVFGGIWLGTNKNGVIYYSDKNFNQPPEVSFLKDQTITSLQYDKSNRGWVTTSNGGVFHIQSLYVTNYYKDGRHLENSISKSLQLDSSAFVFFARNNTVFFTDDFSKPMRKLLLPELQMQKVYQAKLYGDKVYVATNDYFIEIPFGFFTNPKHPRNGIKKYHINCIKDFLFQDSILWIASCRGLLYAPDLLSKGEMNTIEAIKNRARVNRVVPYTLSSSDQQKDSTYSYILFQDLETLWRLRYQKNNISKMSYAKYMNSSGENSVSSNDLLVRQKGQYIFAATKGLGLHIYVGDSVKVLKETDGLLSNNINVLKFQNDSVILAGTNKGLNIIQLCSHKYPRILSSSFITTKDGLKGNAIHDIIIYDQHAIVSTNNGVSLINIPEVLKMSDVFPIYISDFLVNGKEKELNENKRVEFKHNENNIQINYDAIDLHDKSGITYYYRLLGSGDDLWQKTKESSVVFPLLAAGSYNFQVKAQNSYGFRSENTAFVLFTVNQVFYETMWFKFSGVFFLMGLFALGLFVFFSRRNEKLNNEKKLANYQQQSLARTMNPHFIFNVLNSINSFIISNNRKDASFYITQIASLIRQIFYTASENEILISEEGEMLNTYLKLEQRRTKSPFNFIVKADKNLTSYLIPSFMVQLFVENSIWHGFSDEKECGGLVSIVFKRDGDFVLCEILDNGIGRKAAKEVYKKKSEKPNRHEKHGIDVIEKRIELLNLQQETLQISLDIIDLFHKESGKAQGTLVLLKFPIRKQDK